MNLLEFRDFLNKLPVEVLEVPMVASKIYPLENDQEVRLDMPILNFFIDKNENEAIFQVQGDQQGWDRLVEMAKEDNSK